MENHDRTQLRRRKEAGVEIKREVSSLVVSILEASEMGKLNSNIDASRQGPRTQRQGSHRTSREKSLASRRIEIKQELEEVKAEFIECGERQRIADGVSVRLGKGRRISFIVAWN